MSIEERLARLETRADGTDKWLESIDGKVDQLVAMSNMGRGAWLLLLKLGAILTALVAAALWVLEKLHIIK